MVFLPYFVSVYLFHNMKVPIETVPLFPVLDEKLIALLRSLDPADWHKPTLARLWTVKDIAAHLLDGNVRAIAGKHQHQPPPPAIPIQSYSGLVAYLNQLNAGWVLAMQRMSPTLLTDMLETTGKQYSQIMAEADLFAPAPFGVAWAGEEQSANWFHIAREYTEKWHHQQQIRDALGVPGLMARELFYPCIDTFMHALPHTYRNTSTPKGTLLKIIISGQAGGQWYLQNTGTSWRLFKDQPANTPDSEVSLTPEIAWKLFTKAISPETAIQNSLITGSIVLANTLFSTVAVMA